MKSEQSSDKSRGKAQQSEMLDAIVLLILTSVTFLGILGAVQQSNIDLLQKDIEAIKIPEKLTKDFTLDKQLGLKKDLLVIKKDRTKIQNEAYVTILQAIGGIVVGITAYVGYQNLKVGEKTLKATLDKQVTESFSKAIEQLGNKEAIDVCLGGIYTLEQIAIDSSTKYHWTVVNILSAFIRGKCSISKIPPDQPPVEVNEDIQAALTVIGRRATAEDPKGKRIDLRNLNLVGVDIQFANLDRADLRGANFRGAKLNHAHLHNAKLHKIKLDNADLTAADLTAAELNGADFRNIQHLKDANLRGAILNNAHLNDVNLSVCKDLTGVKFCGADLSGAILSRDNNSGSTIVSVDKFTPKDLTGVDLNGAILIGANLGGADLAGANLTGANLGGVDLSTCKNLKPEQLKSAKTYDKDKVPKYLNNR
jgi:uncharacterized protein YjbI with pentapeptide repeats